MAITGTHAIIYAAHPDQTRAFLRDVLGMPHVDAGDGWLIFKTPPAELGVHPTHPDQPATGHELYLMCDDIEATVAELTNKGVEFTAPITDQGFGLVTALLVPGGGEIGLYQPRHPVAYNL